MPSAAGFLSTREKIAIFGSEHQISIWLVFRHHDECKLVVFFVLCSVLAEGEWFAYI